MKYNAHNYQKYATDFILAHPACCLMLDMGLGKTVITLSALWDLLLDEFAVGRVLIIAPKRVAATTWPQEIEKWEHLTGITYSVVMGTEKERRAALMKPAFIYIINRENVAWLVEIGYFRFDMVIVDELSSFKSYQSKRFKALRKVRGSVKRIVGLTGTPGNLMDLWAEIGLIDKGERLGRFITRYREAYFVPDKRNQMVIFSYKPREGAEEEIYDRISDICVSMKARDYLQMPDLIVSDVEVAMSEAEKKKYDQLKSDLVLPMDDGDIDAASAVGLSNKLLQMANGACYDENGKVKKIHDRKLDALEDLIEAANEKPILIAYWFKHDRDRLIERFGAVPIDTAEDIEKWNRSQIPVAIIHPASAGHGLNLQSGGSHLVWFGLTWSLELYQQCCARLYRQGQEHTVTIQHIITKGTIDEDVIRSLMAKNCTQEAIMAAVRARIGGSVESRDDVYRI